MSLEGLAPNQNVAILYLSTMEVHIENVTNLVSSSMQWMPSLPLIEFDQTKRMGHRSWSTDDAYSTHLLVRFKMLHQRGGRSVGAATDVRHGVVKLYLQSK